MRISSYCLLLIALAACGPSPRRVVLGTGGAPHTGGVNIAAGPSVPGSASSAAPRDRLNIANSHLEARGYRIIGPASHHDISQTGLVAMPVEAQPNQCYTVMALGQDGSNIDIIVVDPLGQNVGQNVYQDANPWVHFCAVQPGRHLVRVQLASGSGVFFYAAFQGNGDPELAAVLGGPASQGDVSADSDVLSRIAAVNQQLAPQRFEALLSEPMGYNLAAGGHDGVALQLAAGTCYRFGAFGGNGVRDVGLAIENSNNEMIQRDVDANRDAVVEYCPVASGRFTLSATMVDGAGPLFVTGWRRQAAGAQPTVTPPPTVNVISATTGGGGGLAESFAALNANITARGYEAYGDSANGSLRPGESRDFPLALEGGKCYAIVAQGDGRVSNLDLVLRDSSRREVDRDVAQDPRPIVRVCPERTGEYTMAVNMAQGGGDFVYQAYRWPRGTRGPFGLNGLIYVRLSEVSALLRQEGYSPSGGIPPGQGSLARQGARGQHEIELSGGCVAVLVVGGDGVNDLDVTVRSRSGQATGEDSRNAFPSVRFCPSAGTYTVNVEAAGGSGAYFYQVFERN
ncbi:MAG: hypothetical protein AB8H86_02650 [Polyangiales bacterium]